MSAATTLRVPQVRILESLAAAKNGLRRKEIIEKAKIDPAWLYVHLGSEDAAKCAHTKDKYKVVSLAELKLVKFRHLDIDGVSEVRVEITAKGTSTLAAAQKAAKEPKPAKTTDKKKDKKEAKA